MNRARREIKTPKRFDEEPFETPRKNFSPQVKLQQTQPPAVEPAPKAAPEQTPTKSIIKVKLTKSRPRDPPASTPKALAAVQSPATGSDTPKQQPQSSAPAATTSSQSSQSSSSPARVVHLKPQKRQVKSPPRPVPPPIKVAPDASPQSTPAPPRHKTRKIKSPPRLTPPPPLLSQQQTPLAVAAPSYIQVPSIPVIRRSKIRRPRTPPAYANLIPNLVLPFWDARTAAEDHEDDNVKELVHCQCGISEEVDLMVQCETCLTWQHAHCLGIEKPEDAPDGYTCQACSDPKFARESMRWAYDQDWLLKGRMKHFGCNREASDEKQIETLNRINRLIDNSLKIYQLTHSLRVKSRLLVEANDEDPELRLFRNQWPVNYQHINGTPFVPSMNFLSTCTPTLSLSAMAETPDPGDIPVETVAEATLPDIGQLEDVSAILDNTDMPNTSLQPMSVTNHDATPNDCRSNLRLHIQQTEEFLQIETAYIDKQLEMLEKECSEKVSNIPPHTTFESLRNDLKVIRNYITRTKKS